MSALPYTLSFPSLGCIVVHAGLVPGVDLQDQDALAMSCMRNVVEVEGGGGYKPLTLPTKGKGAFAPQQRFFLFTTVLTRSAACHRRRGGIFFWRSRL